jgi:ATP synthase protein I
LVWPPDRARAALRRSIFIAKEGSGTLQFMGLLLHDVLGDVPGAGARSRVTSPLQTRSFRAMLLWQAVATAAVAAVAGVWAGGNAAWSAVLGGAVNLAANAMYGFAYGLMRPTGPGGAVIAAVRAEASKILLVLVLLLAVVVLFRELVLAAFLATFILTALLFRLVLIVRD